MAVGVEETADDAGLSGRVDDGEERVLGAEGVPDAGYISQYISLADVMIGDRGTNRTNQSTAHCSPRVDSPP